MAASLAVLLSPIAPIACAQPVEQISSTSSAGGTSCASLNRDVSAIDLTWAYSSGVTLPPRPA